MDTHPHPVENPEEQNCSDCISGWGCGMARMVERWRWRDMKRLKYQLLSNKLPNLQWHHTTPPPKGREKNTYAILWDGFFAGSLVNQWWWADDGEEAGNFGWIISLYGFPDYIFRSYWELQNCHNQHVRHTSIIYIFDSYPRHLTNLEFSPQHWQVQPPTNLGEGSA